jgi:VWFA-related protein
MCAAPAPQVPVFRTGIDLVQLDVSVLDKDRQPVRGLTAADFTILEDGKPQTIAAFSAIDLPDVVTPATPWMRDVAPDVTTNEIDNHRVFVLVLDDAVAANDPWATRAVIESATKIVNKMGAGDLATVLFTRDNRHAQDLTSDHARLLKAVNTFSRLGSVNMGCLYPIYSISVLERASSYLAALPQRRKAMVYISPGIHVPTTGDDCDLSGHLRNTIRAAQQANVNFYPIDVCGLVESARCAHYPDFLMTLANNTGGHATVNTNDFEPGITQMFRENSSYYLLGYQSTNQKADGTYRLLDVKVNRPGVGVWTRRNYVAAKAAAPPKPGAPPPLLPSPAVLALADILPKSDLPLRIALAPFAMPGQSTAAVTMALGLRQPAQSERITDDVELLLKAFSPEGDARGSTTQTVPIAIPSARRGSEFTRYEVLTRMDLKPGRYELRISTHSTTFDKRGSVYAEVEVPDFEKAPLSLSGVALSVTPGVPVAPVEALSAIVPVIPTTEREFARLDRVTAFLRVYQGGRTPLAPVTVSVHILDAKGATAFEKADTLGGDRFVTARAADERLALPLVSLTSGDYLLSFEAALDKTAVRRDVRFLVK